MIAMTSTMADAVMTGARREHLVLTVLYDERCPLCRRLKRWLSRQPALFPIEFLGADTTEAHRRFPDLDHGRTTRVLTVVTSDGAVYEGERAWLVCAWALPGWQPLAEGLGGGMRLRVLAVVARAVDVYRHRLVPDPRPCATCPRLST
jgi:predicted DCC family thiol-disulfide oxidoreductase YuxK